MAHPIMHFPAFLACLLIVAGTARADEPGAQETDPATGESVDRCLALRRDQPGTALELAESILAMSGLSREHQIKALACLGMAAAIAGEPARAVAAVSRIEARLDAGPMPPGFSLRALSNAGSILHIAGQAHRALDLYMRAYETASVEDACEVQAVTLTNIGIIHSTELQAHEEAETFYRRAHSIYETMGRMDASLPYNHARNLVQLGREDEALALFEEAIALAAEQSSDVLAYRAESERIALLARNRDRDDAESQLSAIAAIQRELPDPAGAKTTLVRLSQLALARGNAESALRHAVAAGELVSDSASGRERVEPLKAEFAARRALGQLDQALEIASRLLELETSLLRTQNIDSLADLQARLQDADRTREIERLREQSELQSARLDTTRLLRNWALGGLLLLALGTIAFVVYQRRTNRRLRHQGEVDALTGLLNRGAASERLSAGIAGTATDTVDMRRAALFLVDVDHFKEINDRHGHAGGDAILVEIAARLKHCCRPNDIVARWGGEEFLVACTNLDLANATLIAERIRAGASARPVAVSARELHPLTVSIGFACWPFFPATIEQLPKGDWTQTVRLADRALYAAKHAGRDAWVGLWGLQPQAASIDAVLDDPARHAGNDGIAAISSRMPIDW